MNGVFFASNINFGNVDLCCNLKSVIIFCTVCPSTVAVDSCSRNVNAIFFTDPQRIRIEFASMLISEQQTLMNGVRT